MTPDALSAHLQHLRLRDLAASHIRARQLAVGRLGVHLGRDPLSATADELVDYLSRIPRSTPRSRYAEASQLGCFFSWACEYGYIPSDPTRRIPRPRLSRLLPRPISEADLRTAIDNAPPRIRLILVLAAFEGLRACEIAALNRSDIMDHATTPALIAHGKGRKDRVVPLGARTLTELRVYGIPARGPLFSRLDGRPGPTSAHRVSLTTNQYLHDIGISDSLHQCRHRFATQTYEACRDLLVVGALLGHEDVRSTSGYAAYSDTRAVAAVHALDHAV